MKNLHLTHSLYTANTIKQSTCNREQQTVFVLFHAYPLKNH